MENSVENMHTDVSVSRVKENVNDVFIHPSASQ